MRIFLCQFLPLYLVFSVGFIQSKERESISTKPRKVGVTTIKFFDASRHRPFVTEIWYPVDDKTPAKSVPGLWVRCPESRDAPIKRRWGRYPLIVMSHGNGGDRLNVVWLAEILAANGFIVAAMDHYGNTWHNKIAEYYVKIWERPKDVSFVVDQLLKHRLFGAHIHKKRIGFVGYSLGGLTGMWVAGGIAAPFAKSPFGDFPKEEMPSIITKEFFDSVDFTPVKDSYKDRRIKAFFLMAPALIHLFDPASLEKIQTPMHVYVAEGDDIVHAKTTIDTISSKIKRSICTLISGAANHFVFLNEVTKGGKVLIDKRVAHDPPTVNRKEVHDQISISALDFFDTHLN